MRYRVTRRRGSTQATDEARRTDPGGSFPSPRPRRVVLGSLFMLHLAHRLKDESLQAQVYLNLKRMALGGIYDHLGGGFARYSVDAYWKVPHFEKMLYDNGQLLSLYGEAYLQRPEPLYQRVIEETMDFIARELRSEEGGFYSSLDADSEGEEGKFYVWDYAEIAEILGKELKLLADYYNLQPQGNWEGNNVLFALDTPSEFAERWKLDGRQFSSQLTQAKELLFKQREKRIRPGLDDKILASWNGLTLKGIVDAYRALGRKEDLQLAEKNAGFLMEKLYEPGQLYRNYKAGRRSIPAFLDDYAQVIRGLLALYQVSFEERWLLHAERLMAEAIDHFDDPETGLFFYTSAHGESLIRRKIERQDDVIPA
ncbi:MAG: thioredoxin domain-containing protein, partial [Bacteroidota bacterium]